MTNRRKLSKLIHQNNYWSIYEDEVLLPDSTTAPYFRLHKPDGCMVLLEDEQKKLLVIKQFRYPEGKYFYEFPAGSKMDGTSRLESAKIELLQEASLKAQEWIELGSFAPSNGIMDSRSYIFLARGIEELSLEEIGKIPHDDSNKYENITEKKFMSIEEIDNLISKGEFDDGICLAGLMVYKNYYEKSLENSKN